VKGMRQTERMENPQDNSDSALPVGELKDRRVEVTKDTGGLHGGGSAWRRRCSRCSAGRDGPEHRAGRERLLPPQDRSQEADQLREAEGCRNQSLGRRPKPG
jgi:hypothetical protein